MSASRRPQTPASVHSWWSDSNSVGATIPLHTLTKPLLRRMYHRQAMQLLEEKTLALTTERVEALKPYLYFKDVGASTRAAILEHFLQRQVPRSSLETGVYEFAVSVLEEQSNLPRLIVAACRLLTFLQVSVNDSEPDAQLEGLVEALAKHPNSMVANVAWYCYGVLANARSQSHLAPRKWDPVGFNQFGKHPGLFLQIHNGSADDFVRYQSVIRVTQETSYSVAEQDPGVSDLWRIAESESETHSDADSAPTLLGIGKWSLDERMRNIEAATLITGQEDAETEEQAESFLDFDPEASEVEFWAI